MANGQSPKKGKEIVQQMQFTSMEEDVDLPPPNLTSKFKNIEDWLVACSKDKPNKSITKFNVGLFESPNDYTLYLSGINTYNQGGHSSKTTIDFKPKEMYYKLPENFYKGLNRDQILDKLVSQLKEFSNTSVFKTSYLSRANVIFFESNGQIIWSK